MDQAPPSAVSVGIDVAKDRLDVHARPTGEAFAGARDHGGLGERVERRRAAPPGRGFVDDVEEPRQGRERALVPLLLGEEPKHRLGADQPDPEPVRILARRPVRADELDARDRLQLSASLVEDELHVRERFESRAEPRLRPPDPLRDGADAAAVERVEVEHPVCLPEPERAEHDGPRLVRPPGHVSQV